MTKREKILIYFASVLLFLFVCIQFVILPMYKNYESLNDELVIALSDKQFMEMKLEMETVTRENYKQAVKTFNDINMRYPIIVPNEEISRILTNMCIENNLTPSMLGISQPKLITYGEDADKMQEVENSEFTVVDVTMSLNGNYTALKSLVSATEKYEYIRIKNLGLSNIDGVTSVDAATSPLVSVTFEITMLCEMQ